MKRHDKILIVEDDYVTAMDLRGRLAQAGYEPVGIADTPESAIECALSTCPDVVLMDICLHGEMSGIALAEQISANCQIPVVFLTAYAGIDILDKAKQARPSGYVLKPFQEPQLHATIEMALHQAELERELEQARKELTEQLTRSQKFEAVGLLASGLGHDLNNILGPLVALPEIMLEDLEKVAKGDNACLEDLREDLEMIRMNSRRATETIKDLMTFSKARSIERMPVDMAETVGMALESRDIKEAWATNRGVRVVTRLDPDSGDILGSHSHIKHLLGNLVQTAMTAMAETEGGTLTVQTCLVHLDKAHAGHERVPAGDYSVIRVADTGKGLPEGALTNIFDPFSIRALTKDPRNSGMSLAVAYRIVKAHGGYVDVRSGPGQGTTFELFFPVHQAEPDQPDSGDRHTTDRTPVLAQILVVDDEMAQRFLARRILEKLGHRVTEAVDGAAALALFEDSHAKGEPSPFALVLMDMVMEPGLDGVATLEKIRALYPDQKAIVASGCANSQRADMATDLGAGWIPKPYRAEELANAIRDRLDKG